MQLKTILRRIRGTVATALTWSVVWVAFGAVLRLVTPYEDGTLPTVRDALRSLQHLWINWAVLGAIGGGIFAMCLAVDQTRSIRQLSIRRSAMFGVLAGLTVPVGFIVGSSLVKTVPKGWYLYTRLAEFAIAGCACALITVVLSKRAARRDGTDSTDTGDPAQLSAPSFESSSELHTTERTRRRWQRIWWRTSALRCYAFFPKTALSLRVVCGMLALGVASAAPLSAQANSSTSTEPAWITSASGLRYRVLRTGTGDSARAGQSVTIHEVTSLTNGVVVFSSYEKNTPITFLLGGKQVITGVDEGVRGMRVGERRLLEVPPTLSVRSGYPPNTPKDSTLRIDVELVGIRRP